MQRPQSGGVYGKILNKKSKGCLGFPEAALAFMFNVSDFYLGEQNPL